MKSTTGTSGGSPPIPVHARQATGLVREISLGSAVSINLAQLSIAFAVLVATQIPFAFPGASMVWATVFCVVLCIVPTIMYGMLAAAMPRSGGDYVFVGRILHPWVGLFSNFNIAAWLVLGCAYTAFLIPQFGLSSMFGTISATTGNETLGRWAGDVTSDNWTFLFGAAGLVLIAVLLSVGLRRALMIMSTLVGLSIVGVLIAIGLLAANGRSDFRDAVAANGADYDQVIADAVAAGYGATSSFDLGETFLAMALPFVSFAFVIMTAYVGGEVRSARSTAVRGQLWALAIGAVLVIATMGLAASVMGASFLGSATYLSNTFDPAYPFGAPSFFFYFVSLLTGSTTLVTIMGISFVAAIIATIVPTFLLVTRNIFAWSFDRVVPQKLSEVNERTHSPIIANALVLGLALGGLALFTYGSASVLEILATLMLGILITFMVVAVTAVALPFRRSVADAAPLRRRIAGIPVIMVLGLISLGVYGFFTYSFATTDALGANNTTGVTVLAIIVGIALVFWPVSYLVNKRRGVDLLLASKELPPE